MLWTLPATTRDVSVHASPNGEEKLHCIRAVAHQSVAKGLPCRKCALMLELDDLPSFLAVKLTKIASALKVLNTQNYEASRKAL